jgi:chromosome partitioning protein
MGKIVAFCNQKGGVGKTTTAINLSSYIAQSGKQTLLIDADPQANATSGVGVNKREVGKSTYDCILGLAEPGEIIRTTAIGNLSLLPSHAGLTGAEVELVDAPRREYRLRDVTQLLRERFEYIFIDCPPSLGMLTLNALVAADSVIIPLQCEYYALEGLTQLIDTITRVKRSLNAPLEVEGVVLTMADFRTKLTDEVIREVQEYFKHKVYDAIIPRSVRLSEAPGFGKPIVLYDAQSIGAQKYAMLADEFMRRQIPAENIAEPNQGVSVDALPPAETFAGESTATAGQGIAGGEESPPPRETHL